MTVWAIGVLTDISGGEIGAPAAFCAQITEVNEMIAIV